METRKKSNKEMKLRPYTRLPKGITGILFQVKEDDKVLRVSIDLKNKSQLTGIVLFLNKEGKVAMHWPEEERKKLLEASPRKNITETYLPHPIDWILLDYYTDNIE